jgi:hypothetical protein
MTENFFKSSALTESLDDLIKGPIDSLIGVTTNAKAALESIGIKSIFDLAFSEIFEYAELINSVSESVFQKANQFPSNLFDDGVVNNIPFDEIKDLDIKTLRAVTNAKATAIQDALSISKIRELALWPPYLAAKEIVNSRYGIGLSSTSDPDSPQDLIPRTGEYPVEVIYYNTFVLADAPKPSEVIKLEDIGAVEINLSHKESHFVKPGWGAILNFSQKWFAEGITLGSLIKCIPLGPGETTKIAVIDWQRTTSGSTTENITQSERLTNEMQQKRAINEIAEATANESQNGFSAMGAVSTTSNSGVAAGGVIPGLPGLFGASASNSTSTTGSASFSTSTGTKDISSSLQQNIDHSTHQNSFSARNKRASVVTELSESQSETISSRSLTNYNHMHALTLQYWQVVQIFRTEVKLEKYQRLLYIPMKPFDFTNNETLVKRFKSTLLRAAHSEYVRTLLYASTGNVGFEIVARNPGEAMDTSVDPSLPAAERAQEEREKARAKAIAKAKVIAKEKMHFGAYERAGIAWDYDSNKRSWKMPGTYQLVNVRWSSDQSPRIKSVVINVENGPDIEVNANGPSFNSNVINPDFGGLIPFALIEGCSVVLESASDKPTTHDLELKFDLGGGNYRWFKIEFMVRINRSEEIVLDVNPPQRSEELGAALNEQALYYSQQIWLNLDAHYLTLMLSQYSFKDKSVVDYIDPKPVSVAGNCLGFIWKDADEVNDEEWKMWVNDQIDLNKITYQRVALPTDGVFAEAVLGRFNSAEKLDLTRFWNWQDSPIPFSAPDIAAIQSGQQQISAVASPGGLENPILNIMNPAPLPDPTGMQAVHNSLAANIFRDMSGLAQSTALAQAALSASSQGATAAGAQAGANMATFANYQVEMAKILASLAPMLMGLPPAPLTGGKNISNAGAALNAAQSIDNGGSEQGSSGSTALLAGGSGSNGGRVLSSTGASDNDGFAQPRGETGNVMDMITGGGSIRGVPIDFIRDTITGRVLASTSPDFERGELLKIIGDPHSESMQSVDFAEILAEHINKRTSSPDANGVCIDACYQYLMDALREQHVEIFPFGRFVHGFPHIVTHSNEALRGEPFVRLFYSNGRNYEWARRLPESCRGKGAIGALLFADLIANRHDGITISTNKWPTNMVPGTLIQLWTNQTVFEEVRDTGDTTDFLAGHAVIFRRYKDNDPNSRTIIVADQHKLEAEYEYPKYGLLTYVIAAKPAKIHLVRV